MKCFKCGDYVNPKGQAYILNFQDSGVKFYGLIWCVQCGKNVMDMLRTSQRSEKNETGK